MHLLDMAFKKIKEANFYMDAFEIFTATGLGINVIHNGETLLHVAARTGHHKVVRTLLSKGAKTDILNSEGKKPYQLVPNANSPAAKLLRENTFECNIECFEKKMENALKVYGYHACITVQNLINNGFPVDRQIKGAPLIIHAARSERKDLVEVIIDNNAHLDAVDSEGCTALWHAARNGSKNIVDLLINEGADVKTKNEKGFSALYVACEKGHKEIVDVLISKGADVNATNKDGASPLHMACLKGHLDIANLLIKEGADVNIANNDGWSALRTACVKGHKDIADLLISKDANVNATNKNGFSSLYMACHKGHKDIAALLIENGANIDVTNIHGATPLMVAAHFGHEDIVRCLLDKGANLNVKSSNGKAALQYAQDRGHDSIVELLAIEKTVTEEMPWLLNYDPTQVGKKRERSQEPSQEEPTSASGLDVLARIADISSVPDEGANKKPRTS